ncbi:MAG TPA: hypothetical protein VFF17_04650, partial [Thermoanaerobaculia bacterium]|nr:hypothetical protein [Thermoanaerobaculia bacterium]
MKRSHRAFGWAISTFVLVWAVGCATGTPPRTDPAAAPGAPPAPTPTRRERRAAPPRIDVPSARAPSGVLYRVGLKSDLPDLTYGSPGEPWLV